ncbi:MAG: GGDEF domain-containing protein [Lachnospiraceae bacterium]|nr:GGDEF domain-containing protein [Lachnospiraceae bacterium]
MVYKNIAVLITGLDSEAQVESLRGIEEYGKKNGYNIVAFSWFTGATERDKYNLGQVNIANLPDLNLFDGVIVFGNALHMENNKNLLEEVFSNLKCPVVGVGCKIAGSHSICTDGYTAMKEIVEHFIVEHHMTRINFVRGIEGNYDAEERYRAYKDALKEHNIPFDIERVSQGDFYVLAAEQAAKDIMASDLEFPEAIVCANDIMALTICDVLTKNGYNVPEDVAIAGFDYTVEGQIHSPSLTTVRSRFRELGIEACKIVDQVLAGDTECHDVYMPDEVVYAESCGCIGSGSDRNSVYSQKYYSAEVEQRKILYQIITLEKNINHGETFEDWCNSLIHFCEQVNPTEFYCCVNENFKEMVYESDALLNDEDNTLSYTEKVNVILSYYKGKFKKERSFESKLVLDKLFQDNSSPKLYVVSPFNYLDRTFGYFVFGDSEFPINNPLYIHWLINMGHFIENIRKNHLLKNVSAKLDELYIRDSLTGVYNRFGMERFFSDIKQKGIVSKLSMQLSFVDLDGLKEINDKYGHEEGDKIINQAARIMKENAGKYYVVRYGGDEFIVLGLCRNEKEIEDYWNKVQKDVDLYNDLNKKEVKLSLSYGYDIFPVRPEITLQDCIIVADNKMYENKSAKRNKL